MQWVGTLSAQPLLQHYSDLFDTLQVFYSWSEDVHEVRHDSQIIFDFSPYFELSHFWYLTGNE